MPVHVDTWKDKRSERARRAAARIISAMARGVTLQLSFTKSGSHWRLSNGRPVAGDVALALVNDVRVVGDHDGLFENGPCQIWKYDPSL
jgi:hypothetical protein